MIVNPELQTFEYQDKDGNIITNTPLINKQGLQDFIDFSAENNPKTDSHVHYMAHGTAFMDIAKAYGFRILSIMVDYPAEFPPLYEQQLIHYDFYANCQQDSDNISRFQFASTFSMDEFENENWYRWTTEQIKRDKHNGACAVKIWKNVGMVARKSLQINDTLLEPEKGSYIYINERPVIDIVKYLAENKIPLIAHQGEPWDCWQDFSNMISLTDINYYRTPYGTQYYMYDSAFNEAKQPLYADLMKYRDDALEKLPSTSEWYFVGAHVASLEHKIGTPKDNSDTLIDPSITQPNRKENTYTNSVRSMYNFMEAYPFAVMDIAARISTLAYHAIDTTTKMHLIDFIIAFQERILYATDLQYQERDENGNILPIEIRDKNFIRNAERRWQWDWAFLATDNILYIETVRDGLKKIKGLNINRDVIAKIYCQNPITIFGFPEF